MKRFTQIPNEFNDDIQHNYRSKKEKNHLKSLKFKKKLQKRQNKTKSDILQ